ncbi:HugZ family protein [Aestuariispira insulae]|uniref:Uncharacterized protein n=1 Tax=Aestuariispira insulae TaxID=1461337 RepID=A0A3D9HDW0_9PROT|nr:DUF2470 domain-containing protein [Aestuariispira insulae]RED47659.1 hypothetical protein DFP90_10923 [Aestuariispira insulae]
MTKTTALECRSLIRALDRATLATRMAGDPEQPYASLVLAACDLEAAPLLFLSDLAEHTKNLKADGRASLLFDGTGGLDNPLTGSRITVQGRFKRSDDPMLLDRYCRRHPSAEVYRGFKDFHLYRMEVSWVHMVAGFGQIHWVEGDKVVFPEDGADALNRAEEGIINHMNADHSDAIGLYANRLLGLDGVGWRMTGIDPDGCDLRRGGETARVGFDKKVHNAKEARDELVRLTNLARNDD